MQKQFNPKSPAVKRLMREAMELSQPTSEYSASPVDDNLFEWHFTIRGPEGSPYEGGIYHGRLSFPTDYPMKPPNIQLLTPNGRFEVNKMICLSISGYHPETWQPSWSIRTALVALIAFMPTRGAGTLGSVEYTKQERMLLAKKSVNFECPSCGKILELVKPAEGKCNEEGAEATVAANTVQAAEEIAEISKDNDGDDDEQNATANESTVLNQSSSEESLEEEHLSRIASDDSAVGGVEYGFIAIIQTLLGYVTQGSISVGIVILLISVLFFRRLMIVFYSD